jgi:hypothetical protein
MGRRAAECAARSDHAMVAAKEAASMTTDDSHMHHVTRGIYRAEWRQYHRAVELNAQGEKVAESIERLKLRDMPAARVGG